MNQRDAGQNDSSQDALTLFPRLFTLKRPPNNLPLRLSSFVGREHEIAQIEPLVLTSRLVTLTGSGGAGKTRLALEVARHLVNEFADGVCLVELAPLSDPTLVPQAVAEALGVVEQPGRPFIDRLLEYLESRELLLILDNCEHLVAACAELLELLLSRCCLDLRILATSREPIGIPGEIAWRVPSLSLPPPQSPSADAQSLGEFEAVRLFVERAQAAVPGFVLIERNAAAIAQICRRLDGMPLAIELAAARVKVLTVEQIAERLDDRFNLLRTSIRTAPIRHQTLRATIDWSYALLSEAERAVLRRLSVFAGGCALEAAEAVCVDTFVSPSSILDLLSRLADKSLVVAETQADETRYHLLDTIRQYAGERLREANEEARFSDQHFAYYLRLAEQAEPELRRANQIAWLVQLESEHDNLREALGWQLGSAVPGEEASSQALRLTAALGSFWRIRSHLSEGRLWLERALALDPGRGHTSVSARALLCAGRLAWLQDDPATARNYLEQSQDIWRALASEGKSGLAHAIWSMGMLSYSAGNAAAARSYYEQSLTLFREIDAPLGIADALLGLGMLAVSMSDVAARDLCERSRAIFHKFGDAWSIAKAGQVLARVFVQQGDYAAGSLLYEESLAVDQELGFKPGIAQTLAELGYVSYRLGNLERATAYYTQAVSLSHDIGLPNEGANAQFGLAQVALNTGDPQVARTLFQESLFAYRKMDDIASIAACLAGLAQVQTSTGQPKRAARVLGASDALLETSGVRLNWYDKLYYDSSIKSTRDQLDQVTFAAAWAEGRVLQTEQAIAYALAEPDAERGAQHPLPSLTPLRAAKEQFGGLTAREREVAALIAQGNSNREIAKFLVVSERTVGAHISNILSKLEFASRTQIATWAIGKGLARPPMH
jgi:predicted ATPase/DNA-binding CsgD family transcriptional regulator